MVAGPRIWKAGANLASRIFLDCFVGVQGLSREMSKRRVISHSYEIVDNAGQDVTLSKEHA